MESFNSSTNAQHHSWWRSVVNHRQLLMLVLSCVLVVNLSACSKDKGEESKQAAQTPPVAKVKIETVELSSVSDKTTLIGQLDSRQSVALYPKVDGNIQQILVNPGDHIKKGQLVAEIDSLKQEAAVATKASDVATAQADYQKEAARLNSMKAEREALTASAEYQKHEYVRNYWLEQRGVVSESTVDGYDRSYKIAKAKLDENDQNITAQKAVIIRAARAVDAAKFSLKEQKEQLAYYRISSPFSGTVANIPVKIGDFVSPSIKLTTVSQVKPLEVNVLLPKNLADDVRKGMAVEIVDDKNNVVASCPIFHIDPVVDQENQSVLIKALFDNSKELYRPEQSVNTRIVLSHRQGITIPTDALTFVGGRAFAYVVLGGATPVAQQRLLQVASLEGNRAVLKSGISQGEKVVISGVQNLRDGSPLLIE